MDLCLLSPATLSFHLQIPQPFRFPTIPYIIISPIMPPLLYPSALLPSLLSIPPQPPPPYDVPSSSLSPPLLARHLYLCQPRPLMVRLPNESSSISPAAISSSRTGCELFIHIQVSAPPYQGTPTPATYAGGSCTTYAPHFSLDGP